MHLVPMTKLAAVFGVVLAMGGAAGAQDTPALARIADAWLDSPHSDRQSESFTHWDEDGEIPVQCASCHSSIGILDYLGADGSAAGTVDHPAITGSLVDCVACHNSTASALDSVVFPSGEIVNGLGNSSMCMTCHQGRQSGDAVTAATLSPLILVFSMSITVQLPPRLWVVLCEAAISMRARPMLISSRMSQTLTVVPLAIRPTVLR